MGGGLFVNNVHSCSCEGNNTPHLMLHLRLVAPGRDGFFFHLDEVVIFLFHSPTQHKVKQTQHVRVVSSGLQLGITVASIYTCITVHTYIHTYIHIMSVAGYFSTVSN